MLAAEREGKRIELESHGEHVIDERYSETAEPGQRGAPVPQSSNARSTVSCLARRLGLRSAEAEAAQTKQRADLFLAVE